MRYKFEIIKGKVPSADGGFGALARKMQHLMFLKMNNLPISEEDKDLSGETEIEFGGTFLPCEGTYDEHPLYMTNEKVVEFYKDKEHAAKLELAKYFGGAGAVNTGYIGKWNPEINNKARIYYIVLEDGPHEIFLTKYNDEKLVNNVQSVQYIVNLHGDMMDCTPEEGDMLFDDFEEASKYFKDEYLGLIKLKQEIAYQEIQRLKDEELFGKPIETLGDGTYIGQMHGKSFFYQGNKYKVEPGILSCFPVNVIVDVKDGKATTRDWGTPYDKWLKK